MELKEAVQLLKDHNLWRRESREKVGHGLKMTDPKKLGIAIDKVVNKFENLSIYGVSEMFFCHASTEKKCKEQCDMCKIEE